MAPSVGTLRVGRYFLALALIFAALYAAVGFGSRQVPKLGIDLAGGKRVIFDARLSGGKTPSSTTMSQARQIIEDRVNGQGVTGATVQVQNGTQLVVTIPGGTNTDVAELGQPAKLNFRGVMAPAQIVNCGPKSKVPVTPTASATAPTASSAPTGSSTKASGAATSRSGTTGAAGNAVHERPLAAAPTSGSGSASGSASTAPSGSASGSGSAAGSGSASATPSPSTTTVPCQADPIGTLFKTDPGLEKVMPNAESCPSPALPGGTTCRAFTDLSQTRQTELTSALSRFKCSAAETEPDIDGRYYIACDDGKQFGTKVAYLLGHVVVPGRSISSATALAPGSNGTTTTSNWSVNLNLGSKGADNWGAWTKKYHYGVDNANLSPIQTSATAPCGPSQTVPCSDFVGFTLNGQVIAAPLTQAVLTTQTNITGNYNQTEADNLTNQLNGGRLPISFQLESNQSVSATLGTVQLKAAFLAGGIGLLLVVIYSLLYYRGLGFVTIASLLVSTGLTYAMLVILGTQIGFTLDLAGIAGFIVALGITADSFVVFFERIKDEVHEGRSMRVAVPRAWIRARRTILSADTVSFLAAAILYYFAAADVKGFAFTLGLSTILDLIVVFLFTHPIVSLLSRSRTFGSPRFTGLNSVRTGAVLPDEGDDTPRRTRPARAAGASARDRAAGRRGMTLTKERTAVDEVEDAPADDAVIDDAVIDDAATQDATDEQTREPGAPSGATAAERAAARRARRGKQSNTDDREGDA